MLVVRVHNLVAKREWRARYRMINDFEHMLTASGTTIVKLFLHISKKEQLRRFHEREHNPYKRWKITDDDWRNRKKWDEYEHAVVDMVDRTSTDVAPWTLVPAEDKHYARIHVLETICDAIDPAI